MRQACQFDATCVIPITSKQRLVAIIIIDHEMSPPTVQETLGMLAAAVALIIEDNDPMPGLQVIAPVGSKIRFLGFTLAQIQLRHRGFIGVPCIALQETPT
jgi:hypothetical protein